MNKFWTKLIGYLLLLETILLFVTYLTIYEPPKEERFTKAIDIPKWHDKFKPSEFPDGVLKWMDARILTEVLFPLRDLSDIKLRPSKLPRAHVRQEVGGSQHSTKAGTRLSTAIDIHVDTYEEMLKIVALAEDIPAIGGIGMYFDTNTPMLHLDLKDVRGRRLVWIRDKSGKYHYRENGYIKFVEVLQNLLYPPIENPIEV